MKNLKSLDFKINDRIASITLNRPDATNGINYSLAQELASLAKVCDDNPNIRAVLLTAKGRFFSAGGDIKEISSHGDDVGQNIKALADNLHMAISTFARMDAPLDPS